MPMSKIKDIKLETTADYQSISGLNVQFWNQDKGTAILQFNITRNNYPLGLSEENVKVFIALESGDSFLVDDNLDYVDELNGVVAYTIPNEFMRVATSVKGQVYVTTLDEEEVVVQRQFTFNVANDLIADLPAEDKIREIKYFSDMRAEVAQMMEKLNNDFANMNDYVTQVEQTTQDGITALTNLINTKQDAYNANHTAKMKELNDKGTEYSTKFDEDKEYMDDKFQAFQESVNGSGLITTGQSEDWQKYKLTSDDGTYPFINLQNNTESLYSLTNGIYYTAGTPHNISNVSTSGFIEITVRQGASAKRMTFKPYNSNRIFEKWFYNEWSDWYELVTSKDASQIETVQESQNKANTAENNAKQYTDSRHVILFDGEVSGVNSTIQLQDDYTNYSLLVISGEFPGGEWTKTHLVANTKTIHVTEINLLDSTAEGGGIYELLIQKTDARTLTIGLDNYMEITSNTGYTNAGKFTIQRIEGWK